MRDAQDSYSANGERALAGMRALGRRPLPRSLRMGGISCGISYRRTQTIKHDFFAATAFYDDDAGHRVVLKLSRQTDFLGIPLGWLGRWLCRRELRFYQALADVTNVPKVLGTVGDYGFVHAYVPGRTLVRNVKTPDGFFDALQQLLAEVHQRRIAYVDANKSPNILIGDDGRPHLIDFQISWDLYELGDNALNRWWLARLQREDRYHILKHKRRTRPDELTAQEREAVQQRSRLIQLHRLATKPYFRLRRAMFKRFRETGRLLPETTG